MARFSQLIAVTDSLGAAYNPTLPELRTEFLRQRLSEAEAAMAEFSEKKRSETLAITERTVAFDDLKLLVRRLRYIVSASVRREEFDDDLRTLIRRAMGERPSGARTPANPPPAASGTETRTASASTAMQEEK